MDTAVLMVHLFYKSMEALGLKGLQLSAVLGGAEPSQKAASLGLTPARC